MYLGHDNRFHTYDQHNHVKQYILYNEIYLYDK